jgi:hypothetical protein
MGRARQTEQTLVEGCCWVEVRVALKSMGRLSARRTEPVKGSP